jgi:hypothetical protein
MHAVFLMLFAITAGFTASAIIANLYRVCGVKKDTSTGRTLHAAVLVLGGPSLLFEAAMNGLLTKKWHPVSFWLAAAGILYWSLALGLLVLEVAIRINA